MGDITKLTTVVNELLAQHTADQAEIAALKSGADGDQAAIDALTATLVAALPVTASSARTEYEYLGGDPALIDATQWTLVGTAPDGKQLFTFAGDLNPGDATGASADFAVYTG